jgi:trehalose 6-phosphate synthase
MRTRLIFNSIRDQVATSLTFATGADLVPFFERLTEDERLTALGYCDAEGRLQYATKHMPKSVACPRPDRTKGGTFNRVYEGAQRLLVGAFPLSVGGTRGDLIVLHDLGFVDERALRARLYTALAIVTIIFGIGLLALASVLGVLRAWSETVRSAVADARRGLEPKAQASNGLPMPYTMRSLLREFRNDRTEGDGLQVQWTPQTLHRLLDDRLPGTEVIAVSNREPYIHNRANGSVALQIPASGLVAALEPVMRACGASGLRMGADRPTARPWTRATTSASRRGARRIRCAASGSPRRSRRATTTASPTRASGRCATSPSCGPRSATRTGSSMSPSTGALPTP